MNKREEAERNIEAKGAVVNGAGDCKKCALKEDCPYDKSNNAASCVLFCEQWLKDNPKLHEEIMTLWWKSDVDVWFRVLAFHNGRYLTSFDEFGYVGKEWFMDRESATTPPEES